MTADKHFNHILLFESKVCTRDNQFKNGSQFNQPIAEAILFTDWWKHPPLHGLCNRNSY